MKSKTTYTVVYYSGGTVHGSWNRTNESHKSYQDASEFASKIQKQGYVTRILETEALNNIGMPEGCPKELLKN